MLDMAHPVLFVPPDLVELLIYRVDTYAAMDWADALALSMEVDSSFAIVTRGGRRSPLKAIVTVAGCSGSFHVVAAAAGSSPSRCPPIHSVSSQMQLISIDSSKQSLLDTARKAMRS
ncbi:hypothetical protein GCK32_008468 [Trichostrongylus colubriformis]|uniref:Uncharacterized protein n=1 Tax=Trichostrongylus colubriformis TaxID=6319 RepID=A0AAN8FM29_TRICO